MKILLFLLLIVPALAHAAMFDMGEHTGIIKDSTGNFYRVNPAGTVSAIKTGTDLVVTEKINIPTSKGNFAVDLLRNVTADIPRMGKAVRNVAIATGPVGLTISAVQLIYHECADRVKPELQFYNARSGCPLHGLYTTLFIL